jgi:hypothetical protein
MKVAGAFLACLVAFLLGWWFGRDDRPSAAAPPAAPPTVVACDRPPSAPPKAARRPAARPKVAPRALPPAPEKAARPTPNPVPRAPVVERNAILAALAARARVVAQCFPQGGTVPRLHIRMILQPDGRVLSPEVTSTGTLERAARACSEKLLGELTLDKLPLERPETVVWALDLIDRPASP